MIKTPILIIQNNIISKLEDLFKNELFLSPEGIIKKLDFHKGFLPFYTYQEKIKNQQLNKKDSDVPFVLLRYKDDSQSLVNGAYDASATFELIIGTYKESSDGYEIGIYIADKIKKFFMEYSNVPKGFSIKQDYIKTFLLEESSGFYWFHKIEFKVYIPVYDSKIPL